MKKLKIKTLSEFITEIGDIEAGKLFGVTERGASTWRRHERVPAPRMAAHIIYITGGVLAWDSIYGHLLIGNG